MNFTFINFNDFENSLIHENKLIEYNVKNSDITELSSEIKLQFLESYDVCTKKIISNLITKTI